MSALVDYVLFSNMCAILKFVPTKFIFHHICFRKIARRKNMHGRAVRKESNRKVKIKVEVSGFL